MSAPAPIPSWVSKGIKEEAESMYLDSSSLGFSRLLDESDQLARLRQEYHLPLREAAVHSAWPSDKPAPAPSSSKPALYLCGNSLGPMAKRTHQYVTEELDAWATHSVLGHFNHPKGSDRQWTQMEQTPQRIMSDIVGAKPSEVAITNTLTSNLHTLLATFYRPLAVPQGVGSKNEGKGAGGKMRYKIIHERSPFPSDQYTLSSIAKLNNLDPESTLVPLSPRSGEDTLRTSDILATMEEQAATGECWGILLGSVQYLTGQAFELGKIAAKAQELGIFVAYDLAHAFANVPLALHDWGVDFAAWCTYKYGSSGPGGIGGMFVHEKWHDEGLDRPAGWWGHNKATRFAMPKDFDPMHGAAGWQQSNPSALDIAALRGSLETLALSLTLAAPNDAGTKDFATDEWAKGREKSDKIGYGSIMPVLRAKSVQLTGYLEHLLFSVPENKAVFDKVGISLVSPSDPEQRGSQLTIRVPNANAEAQQSAQKDGMEDAPAAAPVAGPTSKTSLVSRIQAHAEENFGLVADIRNPDVIRLAPLAQYSTFEDVWRAVQALKASVEAVAGKALTLITGGKTTRSATISPIRVLVLAPHEKEHSLEERSRRGAGYHNGSRLGSCSPPLAFHQPLSSLSGGIAAPPKLRRILTERIESRRSACLSTLTTRRETSTSSSTELHLDQRRPYR